MSTSTDVEPKPCNGPISDDIFIVIGIITMGLIGAALAGPVGFLMGAIFGMIFGAAVGEEYDKRKRGL